MPRWESGARERLQQAGLELYLEHGFEHVTAEQIAERAGLARRTFFRYFADTREVLFAGAEQLPIAARAAIHAAAGDQPMAFVNHAMVALGELLAEHADHARERRTIIDASPELQERERTKTADLTSGLATALSERGVDPGEATLLAQVGLATFGLAWRRWLDANGTTTFADVYAQAEATLRGAVS